MQGWPADGGASGIATRRLPSFVAQTMMAGPAAGRLALELLDALGRLDHAALRATLASDVRMRALVPGGLVEDFGPAAVAARFAGWFGAQGRTETLEQRIDEAPGGRTSLVYRLRIVRGGDVRSVEQHAFLRASEAGIVRIDLVCSGFVPEPPRSEDAVEFDAGDLGCGTGLPQEFRRRLALIERGARLTVITSDASAREDLPALARLLGHRVAAVATRADGRTEIQVIREK